MSTTVRVLLIYPEFTRASFWNFRATCELRGAKYPSMPLGLLTVAAMLPADWEPRLHDCNVSPLADDELQSADLVLIGGMLPQQVSALRIIARAKALGKPVVVGGPDATSSPHVYDQADYLILGEAEVTFPRWLADFQQGAAVHRYEPGTQRADVTQTPAPRYDLVNFRNYLYPAVQFARGCPFLCEFCDIIELFGRVPRLKRPDQFLTELDRLYQLGHRGHVDIVDDNFVGNKRDVKRLLPELIRWQAERGWPFEFSTEASINLADDEELLGLMQQAGFFMVFVGVESPDEDTLRQMQKKQNAGRSLAESIRRIYAHGMYVSTGYIVGFDNERQSVAAGILHLIEDSATPVNMAGLLYALPGTQLSRRLAREGRLGDRFDRMDEEHASGDQCSNGINFEPLRPRGEILADLYQVVERSYRPEAYFGRVLQMALQLNCTQKKLATTPSGVVRDALALTRIFWHQGVRAPYRLQFWRTLLTVMVRNPHALRPAIGVMAMYLHFADFAPFALSQLAASIEHERKRAAPPVPLVPPIPVAPASLNVPVVVG